MLITSNQLSARHKLKDEQLEICCNNTELERVTEWKLLGLTIDLKSNIEQPYIKKKKKLYGPFFFMDGVQLPQG